jgi:hypothetical protein
MKFMVSNIGNRDHRTIFSDITDSAFFDLAPAQHGWADYLKIGIGDSVYVIDKNRMIPKCFRVTGLVDGIVLEKDAVRGEKVASVTGGNTRVLVSLRSQYSTRLSHLNAALAVPRSYCVT